MKRIVYFVVALISCVLVFVSCKKGSKESHVLDGYEYRTVQNEEADMYDKQSFAFDDGKVKWTYTSIMDGEVFMNSVQTYQYKVTGSKLYIGLDGSDYGAPIEDNAPFTGIVSEDFKTIEMTHHGLNWTYTVYRVN